MEGFGYHSFRLTEVLAAGAIPVIAIDHYVLVCGARVCLTYCQPYQDLLDWENFSIRVPEYDFMKVMLDISVVPPEGP